MTKEKLLIIIKDLLKIYLVYLFFDFVWPDPDMKNVSIASKLFFHNNLRRFIKFGIPGYLAVQLYFIFKKE